MICFWMAALLLPAQDPGPDPLEKSRVKLLSLLVRAREELQDSEQARVKAEGNLKKTRELLELARRNVTDEASRKAVEEQIPKMIEDVRCLADRAAGVSRDAAARIRLTERALADLKSAAPQGPVAALVRKIGARAARQTDEAFGQSHGYLSDPAAEKRMGAILERLAVFAPLEGELPRLKIVKGKYGGLAAFTTTDTIYVLEETLKRAPTDEDLIILLGHELSHAQLGHYASFYVHLGTEEKLQQLQDARDGALEDLVKVDARTSAYSVEQELQAHVVGAQMAIAAGVPPDRILKHFQDEADMDARILAAAAARKDVEATPAHRALERLVRTHPEPGETLKKLREVLGGAAGPR